MLNEEIKKFLNNFAKGAEWRKIRETLLAKLDAPCWLIDSEGNYIIRVTQNKGYCAMMKANPTGKKKCEEYYRSLQEEMNKKGDYIVKPCHAGFLGFQSPITIGGMPVGGVGASQLIDHDWGFNAYRDYAEQLGIMGDRFVSQLDEREAISIWLLETEVGLIALLAQASVDLAIRDSDVSERDILLKNLIEFYRLITEKRSMMLELEEKKLYETIVEISANSIEAEICSLMMVNERTSLLEIKAAVGLSRDVIKQTRVKTGQGVAGYVAASGKPLLVKDITKDERFLELVNVGSPQYYTNSLISTPIKIGHKVVGILNMNNETTRRIFNEKDLKLLAIIAEHASMVIEASRAYRDRVQKERAETKTEAERAEEMRAEVEKLRGEITGLKTHLEKAKRVEQEAEGIRHELVKIERIKSEAARLKEEAKEAKDLGEQERLKQEAAKLTVQAETIEEKKEEERLKEEEERLKVEVGELRREEERLKAEIENAEALIAQAEEAEELREEATKLKEELEKMKTQQGMLNAQIEKVEELRARAEEAHALRVQTEELSLLYELSKEIVQMENPQHILDWLITKILPLFDYHVGAYLLLEEETLVGEIKHVYSIESVCAEDLKKRMMSNWSGVDPGGEVEREATILVDEKNLGKGKRVYPGKVDELVFAAVLDRGQITGLLYVGSFTHNGFKEKARRLLPIVSSHASVAIEKTRKYLETKELAEKDGLTGVYNFRYFGKFFSDEFKRVRRYDKQLSLLMLDFDHLKKFNDTYGHDEGNRLIKTVAEIMEKNVREVDCLARFGGDEFAVALPETGVESAKKMGERILDDLRNYDYKIGNESFRITASIGLASFPHIKAKSPKELFVRADEALYQAKQHGRDQVYAYENGIIRTQNTEGRRLNSQQLTADSR